MRDQEEQGYQRLECIDRDNEERARLELHELLSSLFNCISMPSGADIAGPVRRFPNGDLFLAIVLTIRDLMCDHAQACEVE